MTDWDWQKSREDWNKRGKAKGTLAAGIRSWNEKESLKQTEAEQKLIQVHLPPARIFKLLDFGCGVGRMSQWLQKCFPSADYFGVDFAKEMLEVAKETNPTLHYDIYETKLPYKDEFFGAIFTCTVLQHIVVEEEIQNVVSELSRVLAKNGYAILFENIEPELQPKNPLHVLFRKPEEYIEMFAMHGINLEKKDSGKFHNQEHAVFIGQKL